jgi:hypothetical protein
MTSPPLPPADAEEFNPLRPPASACWWFQRFVDHFIAGATATIEQGNSDGPLAHFVGALEHAMRLTPEQGTALHGVLRGFTPKGWAEQLARGDKVIAEERSRRAVPAGTHWCAFNPATPGICERDPALPNRCVHCGNQRTEREFGSTRDEAT